MEIIDIIKYEDLDQVFVSDHYDYDLNGTCLYNNELCEFKVQYLDYEDNLNMYADIYKLSFKEKVKWKSTQYIFELCVGTHSSPKRKNQKVKSNKFLRNIYFKINKT